MKDLLSIINLLKLQGFQTSEEMFLVGWIMAYGGH
jgi:hypothetical protein